MDGPPSSATPEHVVHLNTPIRSLPASTLPTPFSASAVASTGGEGNGSAVEGANRPMSVLTGNAPVFVPGATPSPAGVYRPKLKLAFSPGDNAPGGSALAHRRKHRRNVSSRGREYAVPQAQTYAPLPSYPPGFAFAPSALPIQVQQQQYQQAPPQHQEHPLVRWWKHFTAEELDRLQNALQDLMFTASSLVDEDARKASGGTEAQKREAGEMKEAQARLGQWVQGLLRWREGLPAGDPRSKN